MRFDVITIGSATVDVFVTPAVKEVIKHHAHVDVCYHIGEKVLVKDLVMDTGGGGTNAAVAFARLGLRTGWLGVLGDDHNAGLIRQAMRTENVAVMGRTVKGMSGYSVIMVGLHHDRAILAYKGVNDRLRNAPALPARWLYCSSMLGPSFTTLVRIARRAKRQGVKYAFNPSMYLAKQGMRKLAPLVDDCDLLILNKEEAAALLGGLGMAVRDMLRRLQQHAKLVVITDGPRGAYATNGIEMFTAVARAVKVVETTGAGDAFAAAVVAGIMERNDMVWALKCGLAESESVIQHVGAKNRLLSCPALMKAAARHVVRVEAL